MALNLILDANVSQLTEPGFWRFLSTRELAEGGNPSDSASYQGWWYDEPTHTLMLRPLQLEPTWLNTAAQVGSILGLQQMSVNAADTAAQAIFEAPAFGNNDNPYIFHVPVGPAGAFPAAPAPFPGSAPSLVGIPVPENPAALDLIVQSPNLVLQPSATMANTSSPPAVTPIGSTADGKFICQTATRLAANQGVFLRWFHPSSLLGFPCIYQVLIGQFLLRIKDVTVEIFRDISPQGDRSVWKREKPEPLFSLGDQSPVGTGSVMSVLRPEAALAHDRYLMWLPFRRNQVLLYASSGKWAIIQVNGFGKRLPDNSDWDIVRSDSLMVWVMTPAAGRFQVQTLTYPSGTVKVQCPVVTLDYTPTTAPALTVTADTDHSTTATAARTQPPSYSLPVNDASDCPPPSSTGAATDPRRQYGIELSMTASGDQKWTPFFYGVQVTAGRVFAASTATPTTVPDVSSISSPVSTVGPCELSAGLDPGMGHMKAEVIDVGPGYSLSPYYYRQAMPIQLTDGGTPIFTGITAPNEVTPLVETGAPRRLVFSATDRWKALADTYLRDQRDWTGFGHIDVVNFIAQQAGINTGTAEYPAGYTPNVLSTLNSPLGGTQSTVAQQTKDLRPGWRPREDDTAASYIKRIQDLYSAWYCGFRLDGTFFYLPREYFTTPAVAFASQHSGSAPYFYGPVTFTTTEPEANVILVRGGSAINGQVSYSGLWVDWQSIKNPAAVNYLGRWRAELVTVGGTFSCSQLNWIARTIWFQTRRRYLRVSFDADFQPSLKIGQVCTLGSYGNYRIEQLEAHIKHAGFHKCTYHGYLVEKGY